MERIIIGVFLVITGFCHVSYGQEKEQILQLAGEVPEDITRKNIYELLQFPNVNKVSYYRDNGKYQKIRSLINNQNWEELYPLLFDYVKNFGIENFFRDNQLLWRLSELTLSAGDTASARRLYRITLKHFPNEGNFKEAWENFQNINPVKKEDFVPLDYYYKLVEYRKEVDTLRPPKGVLLNMGTNINSDFSDYGPSLDAGDSMLMFTSKRHQIQRGFSQQANEDLFFSRKIKGYWSKAKSLEGINSRYNEGSACLSPDRKYLYFSRCNSPEVMGNCDILMATRQDDGSWGDIQNLGSNVNSRSWDSHPAVSHSGDTLYFSSDRIGGFGMADIYFTYRDDKGNWVPAQNAGPIVNTRKSEVSPFYHPLYDILYFSSNGHLLNFGEFDIYKSQKKGTIWDNPKNIGPLVNNEGSEFYFTIDSRSEYLFYARSKKEDMANMDLYSFPLPMAAQPLATTSLRGSISDEDTGEPFSSGIVSIIDLDNGIEVAPKYLRPDGTFEFELINKNNYMIVIQGDKFFRLEEIFFLQGDKRIDREVPSISSSIKFESIQFGKEEAEIRPAMFDDLDKIIDFLLDHPEFKLEIHGHTDSFGSKDFNQKLSQKRADAIKEYIVGFGKFEDDRVKAIGHGSSKPIVKDEQTEEDRRMNRRVEFNLFKDAENKNQ